jgi:hypothetical protein
MTIDPAGAAGRHLRTLQRYRVMFRTSVGFASVGLLLSVIGFAAWAFGPMPAYLPLGLLFVWMGGTLGYKVALSTSRLLDAHGYYSEQ